MEWVSIGSGDVLLPIGIKPLPEPMRLNENVWILHNGGLVEIGMTDGIDDGDNLTATGIISLEHPNLTAGTHNYIFI